VALTRELPRGGSETVARLAASEGLTGPASRLLPPAPGGAAGSRWLGAWPWWVGDHPVCPSPPHGPDS